MFELEVLVGKLFAVDALAAGSVVIGEVAPLKHKLGDDAVKSRPFITEALLLGAQQPEVTCSFGCDVVEKLEDDAASGLASDGDLEEHVGGGGCAGSRHCRVERALAQRDACAVFEQKWNHYCTGWRRQEQQGR